MKLFTKIMLSTVLGLCAAGAVSAQVRNGGSGITGVGLYTGTETAAGTCEMAVTATCFGNSFVLNSFGEWESHHLTVSLNYFNSLPAGGNGFAVTGGNWSLVVVRDNQYAGTLYGEIKDGSIVFPPADEVSFTKITTLTLQATGGLGIFKENRRKKIIGELKITTELNSRETSGRLDWTNF